MIETKSAGGVVIRLDGKVLVVNQHGNSWSLPKGHVDKGERPEQAAMREIQEETGVSQLQFIKPLGTYQRYRIGKEGVGDDKSEFKTILMFLFRTEQKDLQPRDPIHPEAKWIDPEKVADLLTHPKDKEFFLQIRDELGAFNLK